MSKVKVHRKVLEYLGCFSVGPHFPKAICSLLFMMRIRGGNWLVSVGAGTPKAALQECGCYSGWRGAPGGEHPEFAALEVVLSCRQQINARLKP